MLYSALMPRAPLGGEVDPEAEALGPTVARVAVEDGRTTDDPDNEGESVAEEATEETKEELERVAEPDALVEFVASGRVTGVIPKVVHPELKSLMMLCPWAVS